MSLALCRFTSQPTELCKVAPSVLGFHVATGGKVLRKTDIAREFYDEIRRKLGDSLIERYEVDINPKHYTIFSIQNEADPISEWVEKNRRDLSALLINEKNAKRLGDREIEEILGARYAYYSERSRLRRLGCCGDRRCRFKSNDDIVAVLEVANLQLLELRTYDDYLDRVTEKATKHVRSMFTSAAGLKAMPGEWLPTWPKMRVELEKIVDEINNVAKFFGDRYLGSCLSRLSQEASSRPLDGFRKKSWMIWETFTSLPRMKPIVDVYSY